jgi:hypothetical protein
MKPRAKVRIAEVDLDPFLVVQPVNNNQILVIPKPVLSARNLFATGSETADSSRDKAALRNDSSLGGQITAESSLERELRSGN